ncbi:hypothetical protein GALL_122190 [mine drainage metagenome]|uniref:DUF4251 domain-containing protein n=1 Tax=mine drainage metagenome TaxID=410659 RepID=A0A1J5SP15_9ZZZZ
MALLTLISFAFLSFSNSTIAQDKKAEKKKEKAQQIKSIVEDSVKYVFAAEIAIPQAGNMRNLTYGYDVTITKDTINSYLPYFGRAYGGIEFGSTKSPLDFISTKFNYESKSKKKTNGWDINIEIKDQTDVRKMIFSIFDNGSATLDVFFNSRSQISFNGYVKAVTPKKS